MKKQQIAAAACLVAGAIGFAAVYSTQKPGKDEIPTEISQTSSIVEPTEKKTPQKTTEKVDSETKMGQEESAAGQQENQQPTEKQLHFVPENVTNWPVKEMCFCRFPWTRRFISRHSTSISIIVAW